MSETHSKDADVRKHGGGDDGDAAARGQGVTGVTPASPAAQIRDADEKWGCAFSRCLAKARFVVTGASGSEWGACSKHLKEVRRAAA